MIVTNHYDSGHREFVNGRFPEAIEAFLAARTTWNSPGTRSRGLDPTATEDNRHPRSTPRTGSLARRSQENSLVVASALTSSRRGTSDTHFLRLRCDRPQLPVAHPSTSSSHSADDLPRVCPGGLASIGREPLAVK